VELREQVILNEALISTTFRLAHIIFSGKISG